MPPSSPTLLPSARPGYRDNPSALPEFNPFKYNSFPVNAARQAHRLTAALQEQMRRLSRDGRLNPKGQLHRSDN